MLTRPTKFGPYLLLERVSLGGMAEVFKAIEFGVEGFERTVAVKRILPHVAEDEEFITMFKDEARIAVQLQHANIAQIYHLGHEAESFYIALEYVAGRDLRSIFEACRKAKTQLPVPQVCFIMMQVCEGLDYAHNKKDASGTPLNIIHRDVSPPNILVSYEGSVKLCDFGVAKAAGRVSQTQAGILKGKFGYMSPEQVRGRELDRRSDVFAAGVCLWELLTGQRLFHGDTDFSTLEKVRSGTVENPRSIVDSIPAELEAIVMSALAAEPEERIATAAELHDKLRAFLLSQHRDFSRKDLAAWMREQYSQRIEEEKARDASRRRDIERFKRGEFHEPPLPSGAAVPHQPPPIPSFSQVATGSVVSSAQGQQKPVIGGGNPQTGSVKRAPPKPRGRAKTLLNTSLQTPSQAPAQAKAPAQSGAPRSMGWDDDELETRLFEDANSLSMFSKDLTQPDAALGQPAKEEPLARAMRLSGSGDGLPTAADSLGAPVSGIKSPPTPSRRPFRNAAASLGAASNLSQMGDLDFQRGNKTTLWAGIAGAAALSIGLLVWGLSGPSDEGQDTGPELSPKVAAEPEPKLKTGLSIKVLPGDARVTVDGADLCCGEERIADRLAPGSHTLNVDGGAGFFPASQQVSVEAGKLTLVEISLSARSVKLEIHPEPPRASVYLVEDGQARRIGRGQTSYELRREETQSYLIRVSAPGFEPQEIPVPASAESSQRFDVMLAPRGRGSRNQPSRPAAVEAQGAPAASARGTAKLKIGAKLGLPPARVFIDGKEVGRTPINLDVSAGRHRIEWRWSDQRTTKSVSLQDGDTKTILGSN